MPISKTVFVKFLRDQITDDDVIRLYNGGHLSVIDDAPVAASQPKPNGSGAAANGSAKAKPAAAKPSKTIPFDKVKELALKALEKKGLGAKAVTAKAGGNQGQVVRAIRALEVEGKVFRAGERRYTCYGLTQEAANEANKEAEAKDAE